MAPLKSLLSLLTLAFVLTTAPVKIWAAATVPDAASFQFTVTSDLHDNIPLCTYTFDAMKAQPEGAGAFIVSIGDLANTLGQSPQNLRDLIDLKFGAKTLWFPIAGNHDTLSSQSFSWLRAEFLTGHGKRPPLKDRVLRKGPAGSTETSYSFDHGNAHFVMLNEYWNGKTADHSDFAAKGDIVPELRAWLEEDLKATTQPYIFVFGHEPAFAQHRHVGDSLDQYPKNRDAFWDLLVKYKAQAFFSGHVHYYYKQQEKGVYQITNGGTGRNTEKHLTYLRVKVGGAEAQVEVYQNDKATPSVWKKVDTISLKAR